MTPEGARKAVEKWFQRMTAELKEPVEELREIELASLNALEAKLMDSINADTELDSIQLRKIDRVLRIKEQRAKLLGLNAPEKQEISVRSQQIQLSLPSNFNLAALPGVAIQTQSTDEVVIADFEVLDVEKTEEAA